MVKENNQEGQTKSCPKCKESILKDAKKCKHCGADLRNWFARHKIITVITILFVIGSISSTFEKSKNNGGSGSYNAPVNPTAQTASAPQQEDIVQEPLLEIQSFKVYKEYSFTSIEGEVKNISGRSLDNVEAVGVFYDASNNYVKQADALIEYNPILPDQVSPFRVMTTDNPAITQGSISFKYLLGGQIPSRSK